jgi:hypothetical protein
MAKTIRSNAIQNIFTVKSSHDSKGNRILPEFNLLPIGMKLSGQWESGIYLPKIPDSVIRLVFLGNYVYVGLNTSPTQIVKIDPTNMTPPSPPPSYKWIAAPGFNGCRSMTTDGTYIYIVSTTNPGKIAQINPATMATVLIWPDAGGDTSYNNCRTVTFDGTYLYAGFSVSPAKVVKIDPTTMITVAPPNTWTGSIPDNENNCHALISDGTNIYAVLYLSPTKVIKIDPTTMLTVPGDTLICDVGENDGETIAFDGYFLYVGLAGAAIGQVIKVDPTTPMSKVGKWSSTTYPNCKAVNCDLKGHLYVAIPGNPGIIIKINSTTMSVMEIYQSKAYCTDVVFNGTNIYGAFYGSGFSMGIVQRIDLGVTYDSKVFEVDGYAGIEVFNFSDVNGTVYVFNGADPVALAARIPSQAAGYFVYNDPNKESVYWFETGARYAKVLYVTDDFQKEWEFSIQLKTKSNDIMPVTGIVVDKDGIPTKRIKPITVTEDCKVRTEVAVTVTSEPLTPITVNVANNVTVSDEGVIGPATIDIETEKISKFTISASMGEVFVGEDPYYAPVGKIRIEYKESVECPWRNCEYIELRSNEKIDRIYIPTRRFYQISYTDIPDGIDTPEFDFVIVKYPCPT